MMPILDNLSDDWLVCGACGNGESIEHYDVKGAEAGCVWCNQCGAAGPRRQRASQRGRTQNRPARGARDRTGADEMQSA